MSAFFSLSLFLSQFILQKQGVTLWRTRTKLERYLIAAVCLLSIAFLTVLLFSQTTKNDDLLDQYGSSEYYSVYIFEHVIIVVIETSIDVDSELVSISVYLIAKTKNYNNCLCYLIYFKGPV